MDFVKIRYLIEEYRILNGFSSLPFVVESENHTEICWFNYFLDQSTDRLKVEIYEVFTVSDNDVVSSDKVNISVCAQLEEYDEPQMREDEYFSELERLYARYTPEQMIDLIKSAEISPLLPAYKKVAEFVKKNREMISQTR